MEEIGSRRAGPHFFLLCVYRYVLETLFFQRKNSFKKINKVIMTFFLKRQKDSFVNIQKNITAYLLGNSFFTF